MCVRVRSCISVVANVCVCVNVYVCAFVVAWPRECVYSFSISHTCVCVFFCRRLAFVHVGLHVGAVHLFLC